MDILHILANPYIYQLQKSFLLSILDVFYSDIKNHIMSNIKQYCYYGMARPLTVTEAVYYSGFTRQRVYQLINNLEVKRSDTKNAPVDGISLLKWIASRPISQVPGTSIVTYSLKGLMAASGRGRSYVLKMVDANRISHYYIFDKVHFDKTLCDIAMRKEDPLCRK